MHAYVTVYVSELLSIIVHSLCIVLQSAYVMLRGWVQRNTHKRSYRVLSLKQTSTTSPRLERGPQTQTDTHTHKHTLSIHRHKRISQAHTGEKKPVSHFPTRHTKHFLRKQQPPPLTLRFDRFRIRRFADGGFRSIAFIRTPPLLLHRNRCGGRRRRGHIP